MNKGIDLCNKYEGFESSAYMYGHGESITKPAIGTELHQGAPCRDGLGLRSTWGGRKVNERGEDGLLELVCVLVAILYNTHIHSLTNRARTCAAQAAPLYRLVQLHICTSPPVESTGARSLV